MTLAETYARKMWDQLSALTTWMPDVQLSVGDIVSAGSGGGVIRETTLADIVGADDHISQFKHRAAPVINHDGVLIAASGSATVGGAGKARISFSKDLSFLIVTGSGWQETVDQMREARQAMEDLSAQGRWEQGWHLVTGVRRYSACTVIIAKSAGAEVEVSVDASAVLSPSAIRAGASVSLNSDKVSQWAMDFTCTPFYEAIGMKRRGWLRQEASTQTRYLTRDEIQIESDDDDVNEEILWTAHHSSPMDLGLL